MRRCLFLAALTALAVTSGALAAINEAEAPGALRAERSGAGEVELIPLSHRMVLLLEFELIEAWRIPPAASSPGAHQRSPMSALTVYFEIDRAAITPGARRAIDHFFDRLDTAVEVTITGHADRVGPERDNPGLSRRRAEAVKRVLLDKGLQVEAVETFRLDADSRSAPALPARDGLAPLAGRRAVVTILKENARGREQCAGGRLGPPQAAAAAALWPPPCRAGERPAAPAATLPATAAWMLILRVSVASSAAD